MRTAFFFTTLLLFCDLHINAKNYIFNVDAPCLACNIPGAMVAGNITDSTATLGWAAVAGASKYTIEIQDEQNTPSTFHIETNVSGTTYSVAGLKPGVLYKFKVRARCGGDKSDWSDWVFFKAGGGSSGGGSGPCSIPAGLTASITGDSALLSWNVVNGAAKYTVEIEDEQNTPSTFHIEATVSGTSYIVKGLKAGVSYKFKVRTHCGGNQSDWSSWLFFNGTGSGTGNGGGNTTDCVRPSGPMAINVTSGSVVLIWSAVPGVSSYTVEVEKEPSGASPWQITKAAAANTLTIDGLSPQTRYKFKVRSNCSGGGNSDWTAWRKFKTAASLVSKDDKLNANTVSPNDNASINRSEDAPSQFAPAELTVWPNPVVQRTATVRVQFSSTEPVTLRLLDLAGRVVQMQSVQPESGSWEGALNLDNHLPDGVYFLQARNSQQTKTIKLIINR